MREWNEKRKLLLGRVHKANETTCTHQRTKYEQNSEASQKRKHSKNKYLLSTKQALQEITDWHNPQSENLETIKELWWRNNTGRTIRDIASSIIGRHQEKTKYIYIYICN